MHTIRLTTQRASKLVYIYHNARLLKGYPSATYATDESNADASNAESEDVIGLNESYDDDNDVMADAVDGDAASKLSTPADLETK